MENIEIGLELQHKIYVLALRFYRKSIKSKENYGLCKEIRDAVRKLITDGVIKHDIVDIHPYSHFELYTEIYKYKPNQTYNGLFWFGFGETNKRIEILNNAILATQQPTTKTNKKI